MASPPSPKRRKLNNHSTSQDFTTLKANCNKWKTQSQQQLYSSKLVQALRQVHSRKACEVRAEADKVLAKTAKGRTRWSRAILSRVKMSRLKKVKRVNKSKLMKKNKNYGHAKKNINDVDIKVKMLGKLVPGCKGLPVSNLLEEVGDYIAALEMQVKAMTAITQLLSSPPPVMDGGVDLPSTGG